MPSHSSISSSASPSTSYYRGNALVTGASRGIGEATAIKLAQEGYSITLASRSAQKLTEVKGKLPIVHADQKHYVWELDLSDISAVSAFKGAPLPAEKYDLLFSNAGFVEFAQLVDSSEKNADEMYTINLYSPIALTRTLVKAVLGKQREKPFHIIYNTSMVSFRGLPNIAIYSATKSALDAFMRSLARELGPKGIHVNSVNPGATQTEMTSGLEIESFGEMPISGWVTPDAIADAVVFLAKSKNITGIALPVDNGYTV